MSRTMVLVLSAAAALVAAFAPHVIPSMLVAILWGRMGLRLVA